MMRNKKIMAVVLIFASVATLFAGCGKGDNAMETTLYIEKKGKVTEAIVEAWDKDFFSEKDLKSQIDSAIKDFESTNKKGSVSLDKYEIVDKKAHVNLIYDSMESYSEFDNVVAFMGTISDAQLEGYSFEGEFLSTEKKPSITIEELDGSKNYNVVILSDCQKVSTDFKILYASGNVKVEKGNKTAVISDVSKNNLAYLIYKK